jgi:hypothetical protein
MERHIQPVDQPDQPEHIWEPEPAKVNFICSKVLAGRHHRIYLAVYNW